MAEEFIVFDPLPANHYLIGKSCSACEVPFSLGAVVVTLDSGNKYTHFTCYSSLIRFGTGVNVVLRLLNAFDDVARLKGELAALQSVVSELQIQNTEQFNEVKKTMETLDDALTAAENAESKLETDAQAFHTAETNEMASLQAEIDSLKAAQANGTITQAEIDRLNALTAKLNSDDSAVVAGTPAAAPAPPAAAPAPPAAAPAPPAAAPAPAAAAAP